MKNATTVIRNKTGLHARPATDFVAAAKKFESSITISDAEDADSGVNAKSIVMLLASGFAQGTTVKIEADGPDEETAVDELIALIDSGFGEEE